MLLSGGFAPPPTPLELGFGIGFQVSGPGALSTVSSPSGLWSKSGSSRAPPRQSPLLKTRPPQTALTSSVLLWRTFPEWELQATEVTPGLSGGPQAGHSDD